MGKVRFPLLLFGSSVFLVSHARFSSKSLHLKPDITCTFLIHYGSLQEMLTAFFDFVLNTQKRKWTIFLECLRKMFLSIKKLSLSFMPHVGPKWNIYVSHYCAKFEHKV